MIKKFQIFKKYNNIIHGVTTKQMGSFDDDIDFGTSKKPIFSNQLHGDDVLVVDQSWLQNRTMEPANGDAFITNKPNIPLAVKVADCQGVLIFDPIKNVIAAVHSGWRGSVLNIIGKTIKKMSDEFGSSTSDLLVGISPSLGPCCAEFSDPKNELPKFAHSFIKGRDVDFWGLSMDQLKKSGVPEGNIELMGECTKCNKADYFSHRNGDLGRMGVFISLA